MAQPITFTLTKILGFGTGDGVQIQFSTQEATIELCCKIEASNLVVATYRHLSDAEEPEESLTFAIDSPEELLSKIKQTFIELSEGIRNCHELRMFPMSQKILERSFSVSETYTAFSREFEHPSLFTEMQRRLRAAVTKPESDKVNGFLSQIEATVDLVTTTRPAAEKRRRMFIQHVTAQLENSVVLQKLVEAGFDPKEEDIRQYLSRTPTAADKRL